MFNAVPGFLNDEAASKCKLHRNGTTFQEMLNQQDQSQFPDDFFTLEQRQRGAVLLHLFGGDYLEDTMICLQFSGFFVSFDNFEVA